MSLLTKSRIASVLSKFIHSNMKVRVYNSRRVILKYLSQSLFTRLRKSLFLMTQENFSSLLSKQIRDGILNRKCNFFFKQIFANLDQISQSNLCFSKHMNSFRYNFCKYHTCLSFSFRTVALLPFPTITPCPRATYLRVVHVQYLDMCILLLLLWCRGGDIGNTTNCAHVFLS